MQKKRKELGISQEEMADRLYISPRQYSRIETGERKINIWEFKAFFEVLGIPASDFWIIYLETNEYEDYALYNKIKKALAFQESEKARELIKELNIDLTIIDSYIKHFIAYALLDLDENINEETRLEKLYDLIKITIPNFDINKISEYNMNYNEFCIIGGIAKSFSLMGKLKESVLIDKAKLKNRERLKVSEEDKAYFYPATTFNLSNDLGKLGRYKESLNYCNLGIDACKEYNNFRVLPVLLHNKASCLRLLGEEEQIYKTHLIRAYHMAHAMGMNNEANIIKKSAKEDFGIESL